MSILMSLVEIFGGLASGGGPRRRASNELFEVVPDAGPRGEQWALRKLGLDLVRDVSVVWLDDRGQELSTPVVIGAMKGRPEVRLQGPVAATPSRLRVSWTTSQGDARTLRLTPVTRTL